MFLVGLTGGVGTGKSTMGAMFTDLGVPVIDADVMARRVVEPGRKAWRQIRAEFGPEFFHPETGELDRAKLRKVIFEDAGEREKLNRITHSEIYREMFWEAMKCAVAGHQYVILDLPLLFEAGVMVDYMHKIIVVSCEEDLQLQRIMEQRKLSERDSKNMIGAQMPLEEKEKRAQYTIENSGALTDSLEQVEMIHAELSASKFHWKIRLAVGAAVGSIAGLVYFVTKNIFASEVKAPSLGRWNPIVE